MGVRTPAGSGSRESAAVVPIGCVWLPVCPLGAGVSRCLVTGMESVSGGGERVVGEFGQDGAGLPDDLAGLRQGGAVAVLAVLGRVVGVVGADDRAWVLPTSYTAQHSTGGPCRDRRPVHPSTGNATSSRPANRTRYA